ncbi:MAG: glycosyltransferase family 4 protein [Clostridia bacterium]|nr:glycosyltransferase family 4 protein [Clostridia bacterium]
MEVDNKINVIVVDFNSSCITGINRFSESLKCLKNEYSDIRIHYLAFESERNMNRIICKNGSYKINFYYPNRYFISKKQKKMYMEFILYEMSKVFCGMNNIIWHMNHLALSTIVSYLRSNLGGKYILHLHCLPWKYFIKNPQKFKILYNLYVNNRFDEFKTEENSVVNYREADKIICLSRSANDYLVNIQQIEPSKIIKIYNGLYIDLNYTKEKRKELTILFVGRVTKDKGILDFLDAILDIYNNTMYRPKIVIAGFFVISKDFLEQKYKQIDIEYLGQISFEELKELYKTSTFGVIPSLHEQCSYVAIEMAAFGLPMIVSNVDALSEMFTHKKDALLNELIIENDGVVKANKKIFINNIIELIEDKELRKKLSENATKLYFENFTLCKMRDKLVETYKTLIN